MLLVITFAVVLAVNRIPMFGGDAARTVTEQLAFNQARPFSDAAGAAFPLRGAPLAIRAFEPI